MTAPPISFRYEGDGAWAPSSPFAAKRADGAYVIGMDYTLIVYNPRSDRSHNHFFAQLSELWQTLPEAIKDEYPSAEHLRKKALIRTGYAIHTDTLLSTNRDAILFAAMAAQLDEYCIVEVKGRAVRRYTAKSQSRGAMPADEFQRSKNDVLAFAENLLKTTSDGR